MNLKNDEFYKNILDQYFKEKHGTKLFRTLVKLDKKEDSFHMEKSYDEAVEQFHEEINDVMTVIDITDDNLDENELLGMIFSGFKNLNPALIHIGFEEEYDRTKVLMKSYAGEGLIKQKTNVKGMQILKEYFGKVNVHER